MDSVAPRNGFQEEWGIRVLFQKDIDRMSTVLGEFLQRAQVSGAFLFAKNGYMVAKAGASSSYGLDALSDLAVRWFDSLRKSAGALEGPGYLLQNPEEGQEHVHLSRVHRWAILAVLFEELQTVGRVREEALQASGSLTELLVENERRHSGPRIP